MTMFRKLLVANRGEIACRVMRTAKRLGIKTVAVFSKPDQRALHVREADESICIGPALASQSYLNADRLITVCQQVGADAVHPGYGFLSENPLFAEKLASAGIIFVGPPPNAIRSMGDKVTSKKIAAAAKVNVIPGILDTIQDADHAVQVAHQIGYPVMLKASAGGGGKGMRVAHDDRECREGFTRAASEAKNSFGDDRIFIEKFIEQPRHIEIQILADAHGQVVYLGERECSIQRRHQKIIEEAPSPFLNAETRKAMGMQAVALAKAVGYVSAGTVEFIVDPKRNFYFLETNTRLQVEHPITEMVTGLDIVELMLRVAAGEPLPFAQKDVQLKGWAIEARVYAEDPWHDFLPSTGRLVKYQPPPEKDGVRVDTGVYEGGEVSMHYDPMMAKLVVYAENRPAAINKMQMALDRFYIRGVQHNVGFLASVLHSQRFFEGRLSTNFIPEEYPHGCRPKSPTPETRCVAVALIAALHHRQWSRYLTMATGTTNWPLPIEPSLVARMEDGEYPIRLKPTADGLDVQFEGEWIHVDRWPEFGAFIFDGMVNGVHVVRQLEQRGIGWRVAGEGTLIDVSILSVRHAVLHAMMPEKPPPDLSRYLLSPMPGLLLSVAAKPGQKVRAGEVLAVVEAMKMQNTLLAPHDVTIAAVLAEPGQSLTVDQPVLEFGA